MILGYAGVAQFFPGVALGLFSRRVTMPGVFAGLVAGIFIAGFLMLSKRDPYLGLNAGFLGLCGNLVVTAVVSLLTPMEPSGLVENFPEGVVP